jgi:prolyl oligopeptidase
MAINKTYLVVEFLRDVKSVLELRSLSNGHHLKDIEIPIGTLQGFSGFRDDSIMFYSLTSFLIPSITYSYDFNNNMNPIKVRK